jgi:hypothetical protein
MDGCASAPVIANHDKSVSCFLPLKRVKKCDNLRREFLFSRPSIEARHIDQPYSGIVFMPTGLTEPTGGSKAYETRFTQKE